MSYTFDWKRRALYLGYQEDDRYPCYITDTITPFSPYFNVSGLKETLTGGKNLFKINPTENVLQIGSEVLVEVADQFGNAIYTEVTGLIEDQYHLVTCWVYNDFPSSRVNLTILATATVDLDGSPITGNFPDGEPYWNGQPSINPRVDIVRPNVRWSKQLFVDPNAPNTDRIVFSFMPQVKIEEKIRTYASQSYEGPRISGSVFSASYSNPPPVSPANIVLGKGETWIGNLPKIFTTEPFFSSSMVGASVKFPASLMNGRTPSVNASNLKPGDTLTYETSIHSVVNSTTARLNDEYEFFTEQTVSSDVSKGGGLPIYQVVQQLNAPTSFDLSAMQITQSLPPTLTATENSESFSVATFKSFRPVAGDVHRIVTKIKSHGTIDNFKVVGDQILEASELLVDTGSTTFQERWGVLDDPGKVNSYWEVTPYEGALAPSMSRDADTIMDALLVSSSGTINGAPYYIVTNKDKVEIDRDSIYTLRSRVYLKRTPDSTITSGYDPVSVKVFLSGSGVVGNSSDPDPELGLFIGAIESSQSKDSQYLNEYKFQGTFSTDAKIIYKVEAAAAFFLAESSLKSETVSGFTPEQFQLVSLIPTNQNDDMLDFKFELYNPDNVKAEIDLNYQSVDFTGGNLFINNALLSGQMGIGENMAAAGFMMAGDKSAYLRTVGPDYPGFNAAIAASGSGAGILLYSGSIGDTLYQGTGDNYSGVGMELVADSSSFFKFRSDTSELEVRAKKFFVGDDTTQFISGALGNIEISSSGFHLSPTGDVIMQGQITAEAGGTIGGWAIGDTFLSASNIILSSSGEMRTADFQSSLLGDSVGKGWRIDSSGEAEFENAKIRGTLRTAVFEKDTISAVGGAVIIANATVTTGSDVLSGSMNGNIHGVPSTSIQVESVGGFTDGEFLVAKSVEDTGFTNEVFKIFSSSINPTPTLHVSRSLNGNTIPTMSAAQVIVSQAPISGGFILMNATSGSETPFIDIVERTGSGFRDVEIKTRLGDLSGLNESLVGSNPGHGLFGQNVFLTGKLEASVLSGQVIEVTSTNFTTFLSRSVSADAFTLVLDGSTGGQQALNVIITTTNDGSTTYDPLTIKGILAPDVTNATNVDVNIEIGEEITQVIKIDTDAGGVAGATMAVNTNKFFSTLQSVAISENTQRN